MYRLTMAEPAAKVGIFGEWANVILREKISIKFMPYQCQLKNLIMYAQFR